MIPQIGESYCTSEMSTGELGNWIYFLNGTQLGRRIIPFGNHQHSTKFSLKTRQMHMSHMDFLKCFNKQAVMLCCRTTKYSKTVITMLTFQLIDILFCFIKCSNTTTTYGGSTCYYIIYIITLIVFFPKRVLCT